MENRKIIRLSFRFRAALTLRHQHHLRRVLVSLIVLVGAVGTEAPCRADLVLVAPNVTVGPGSSGSFDVLITSTGGTFDVASDVVELSLTGLSGVSFTDVSIATVTPYIYGGNSATTQGSTFTFSTFPGTQFETFDFLFPTGAQSIGPGDHFGLVDVQYSVAANAIPGASGTLTFGPDTSLADASGNNVAFTAQNGSITVSSIPEPSGVTLLAIGCAAVVAYSARRRSATSKS
jgi:hypothetical protein